MRWRSVTPKNSRVMSKDVESWRTPWGMEHGHCHCIAKERWQTKQQQL